MALARAGQVLAGGGGGGGGVRVAREGATNNSADRVRTVLSPAQTCNSAAEPLQTRAGLTAMPGINGSVGAVWPVRSSNHLQPALHTWHTFVQDPTFAGLLSATPAKSAVSGWRVGPKGGRPCGGPRGQRTRQATAANSHQGCKYATIAPLSQQRKRHPSQKRVF
ncbi:hypothetical protein BC831DRAFT_9830 [Entophlyctis helioformis]|nr:hypothetical protein BC831DRAFT_9830 [Entophlyctis helioformis]